LLRVGLIANFEEFNFIKIIGTDDGYGHERIKLCIESDYDIFSKLLHIELPAIKALTNIILLEI